HYLRSGRAICASPRRGTADCATGTEWPPGRRRRPEQRRARLLPRRAGVGRRDVGAGEAQVRAARGRAALALVAVAVGAVSLLGGRGETEEAELADLHARPQLDRQG